MADNRLENFLLLVSKLLSQFYSKKIITSYGLIGGLAVGTVGIPRATKDIDFLVSTEDIHRFYENLSKALGRKFSLELNRPEFRVFPYYSIICYMEERDKKLRSRIIDILIATESWQVEISKDTVTIDFVKHRIPVVNTEGLIILKLKSAGTMDILDVQNILKIIDVKKLDKEKLQDWARRAGVNKLLNKIILSTTKAE